MLFRSCGPSAIDILVGEITCDKVHLRNTDSTALLVGLAGIGACHHGLEFQLNFLDGSEIRVSANALIEKGQAAMPGCDIVLTCSKIDQVPVNASIPTKGVLVDNEVWREACVLAARTHVPENLASRTTGAGAGLTDND